MKNVSVAALQVGSGPTAKQVERKRTCPLLACSLIRKEDALSGGAAADVLDVSAAAADMDDRKSTLTTGASTGPCSKRLAEIRTHQCK